MSEIEITQEDRDAAANVLMRMAEAIDGEAQVMACREAFASHRHEARAEALEEAAKVADQYSASRRSASAHAKDQKKRTEARDFESMAIEGTHIATAIRALRSGEREG